MAEPVAKVRNGDISRHCFDCPEGFSLLCSHLNVIIIYRVAGVVFQLILDVDLVRILNSDVR